MDEKKFFLDRANRKSPKKLRKVTTQGVVQITAATAPWKRGNAYAHTRTGFRPDLKLSVRSNWEANFLRILTSYDIPFEFEPCVFTYPIKRGNKAYTPDILLPASSEWIELKGYFDKNSQIKIRRFKKYYPQEFANLTMVISKSSRIAREFCELIEVPRVLHYEELSKQFKDKITNWEGR
ncbi:MAG TPA: hypothetical protein VJ742_11960 [Nitrososphaera sp.]|nr:hypothetical protein [Nitrososphaera sp.]